MMSLLDENRLESEPGNGTEGKGGDGGLESRIQGAVESAAGGRQNRQMLESILNGIEALICVCELGTFKILFLNDSIRANFGIEGDGVGEICYRLLQRRDEPCVTCPWQQLHDNPDVSIVWEHREAVKGSVLRKTARAFDWPGGGKAHLEYAIEITELKNSQEAIERRDVILQAVNSVASILVLSQTSDFRVNLLRCMAKMAEILGVDRVYIWKNSVKDGRLRCSQIYEWSEKAEPQQGNQYTEDVSYTANWDKVLSGGRCVNNIVSRMSRPEQERLSPQGILSILMVPMFLQDEFWGFIGFDDCHSERLFSKYEESILRSCGMLIANALLRDEMHVSLLEASERMKAQAYWYKSILDATPLPISVTDTNMNWTFVNRALESMLGTKYEDMIGKPCSNWNSHICGTRECGVACAKRNVRQTFFRQNGSSYQVDIGTLHSPSGELTGFIEAVQDITQIENMQRRQGEMERNISQLEKEAGKIFYDLLTGIYSRRFFEENIDSIIGAQSRAGSTLSLIMADIDFFKQYNDTYGHIRGDECLRIIAETLRSCMMRKNDFVARYGGEEFVIVLPVTDEAGAQMIAERILNEVRRRGIPHEKSSVADCVTISLGVVSGRVRHTHTRDDFLRRADEMLYESKHGGRNRYTFAQLL